MRLSAPHRWTAFTNCCRLVRNVRGTGISQLTNSPSTSLPWRYHRHPTGFQYLYRRIHGYFISVAALMWVKYVRRVLCVSVSCCARLAWVRFMLLACCGSHKALHLSGPQAAYWHRPAPPTRRASTQTDNFFAWRSSDFPWNGTPTSFVSLKFGRCAASAAPEIVYS